MGADYFVAYFGVRFSIDPKNETELTAIENGTDQRIESARNSGLKHWFGRLTDGSPHHLLIGHEVGVFGVEGAHEKRIETSELLPMIEKTTSRLHSAGFKGPPALLLLFEAQY